MGVNSLEKNPRDNSGVYLRIALLPYYIIQEDFILLVARKTIQGEKTWAQTTLHRKDEKSNQWDGRHSILGGRLIRLVKLLVIP